MIFHEVQQDVGISSSIGAASAYKQHECGDSNRLDREDFHERLGF